MTTQPLVENGSFIIMTIVRTDVTPFCDTVLPLVRVEAVTLPILNNYVL